MGNSSSRTALLILLLVLPSGCRIDHGLAPRPASWSGIEGALAFQGEWLEDLEEVRVAVYRNYPPAHSSDFFKIAGFSEEILPGVARSDYRVPLVEGDYKWVVVAGSWISPIFLNRRFPKRRGGFPDRGEADWRLRQSQGNGPPPSAPPSAPS